MRKTKTSKLFALPLLTLTLILCLCFLETQGFATLLVPRAALAVNGSSSTVTAIVQFTGEPLARVLPDRIKLAALARARTTAGTKDKLDPEAMAVQDLAAPQIARLSAEAVDFERNIKQVAPDAVIHARFDTLLDGVAVTLSADELPLLNHLPGVKSVSPTRKLRPVLFDSVPLINAPAAWDQVVGGASNAGLGERIAIVDTGIDQTHPFLTDISLVPPSGFPRGDTNYTSNKVIVARSYPPAGSSFSPQDLNGHGTHVSGIATGVAGVSSYIPLGGVAPKAFLMNYNVFGNLSDADQADIARAVEDAVNDGADVVNLSLGGPSEGLDDPLVIAIRNGIRASVVFVIAAGNSGPSYNTILSPGITPEAITVGASTKSDAIASFSSRGPNFDLTIKPDLVAPGYSIYSSRPNGSYAYLSGTSMATPHVTGAVALLRQLHQTWTPAQVKSALMNTADFTSTTALNSALTEDRGAGRIDLAAAANPGLTIDQPSISLGTVSVGSRDFTESRPFVVTAQSSGGGTWNVDATQTVSVPGISVTVSSPSLIVASDSTSTFNLQISAAKNTQPGDYEGYVTLANGTQSLHLPYQVRVVDYAYSILLFPLYKNAQP